MRYGIFVILAAGCGESMDTADGFIQPAHWVDSYPEHGAVLAAAPGSIVVNFNFDLHPTVTSAQVFVNDKMIPAAVSVENRVTLRIAPDGADKFGTWKVVLDACWPDASCHDGQFVFTVDELALATYEDHTSETQVQIAMRDTAFSPERVIVRAGTELVWLNEEGVDHYVNSDPHPSHTSIAALNSPAMNLGESFRFAMTTPGEWGIHCSAHHGMVSRVVVVP